MTRIYACVGVGYVRFDENESLFALSRVQVTTKSDMMKNGVELTHKQNMVEELCMFPCSAI